MQCNLCRALGLRSEVLPTIIGATVMPAPSLADSASTTVNLSPALRRLSSGLAWVEVGSCHFKSLVTVLLCPLFLQNGLDAEGLPAFHFITYNNNFEKKKI